jgi:hypothetical protein
MSQSVSALRIGTPTTAPITVRISTQPPKRVTVSFTYMRSEADCI